MDAMHGFNRSDQNSPKLMLMTNPTCYERFFPLVILLILGLACKPVLAADKVSQDLDALRGMTAWNVTQPTLPFTPDSACGISDPAHYHRNLLDHEIGSDVDNQRATHQIELLDRQVTGYLKQHHWTVMDVGSHGGAIPDLKRCYRKQGVVVQIFRTTGRCTMNSPCTAFDGFSIIVYQPGT